MGTLNVKDGSLVIDGTEGIHGVVFPDLTTLYSALPVVKTFTSVAGTCTIDWNTCDVAMVSLTENTTFVFQNGAHMKQYVLEIKQPSSYTVTMPATVRYNSVDTTYAAPTINKRDNITLQRQSVEATYDVLRVVKSL